MSGNRTGGRNERLAGLGGLVLVGLTAAVSLWLAGPPPPLPADAGADRFAAGRAMRDVVELSREPRPIGSPAHRVAREYLLGRMAELGLAPEVHETTVAILREPGHVRAARVRNLVGRRPGRGGGAAGLLVAHYDSRPNTPGAGDDASGVAVVLEAVRALSHGPPLAGDLIVLLADGEELGLLGARGFAEEHPWMEEIRWVLNFEGRGSRGPTVVFETGRNDLDLVRAFARAAPYPLASSLSAAVYARMPNDTDFTAFRSRGLGGLNFAFLGGLAAYHTALDTAERLDPASLQHAGANAVALVRELDGGAPVRRDADGVWFNPLGSWLVVLPVATAVALAVAVAVLTLAVMGLGARAGRIGLRAVTGQMCLAFAAAAAAPLAGWALWRLFADNAPALLDTPYRLPHRLEILGLALLLSGVAAVAAVGAPAGRRRPVETALGVGLCWSVLGLLVAALLPGGSFLFWWPAWGLIAAAAVVMTVQPPPAVAVLFLTAGALPGVALLAPLAVLVFQALTPHLAAVALLPAALVVCLALPALLAATGGRQGISLAAMAASLLMLAVSVWGPPDASRPRSADLVHLEELDAETGFWLSRDERLHPWVVERLGGEPETWEAPSYLGFPGPVSRSDRSPAAGTGPEALRVEDLRDDGRLLTVRLRSPDGAPIVRVEAATTVQITAVEVAGRRFDLSGETATRPLRLDLAGLPPEGLEAAFHLPDRWPVEIHLTEQFYGLPEAGELPPGLIPHISWTSHSRLVHRSFLR